MGALLFLVLLLYMIGKNENLFGATYTLKVRFENVQGLVPGNNVRFSGIQAGTVKRVKIISDTVIEVSMSIEKKMKKIIRKNAIVSIGTDGLVGNKVVNIVPGNGKAPLAGENDLLVPKKTISTVEMLQTLSGTNNDVAVIASELKSTIQRINNAQAVWGLLNDMTVPREIQLSAIHIRMATERAKNMAGNFENIVNDIKSGRGSLGNILTDTTISTHLDKAILKIKTVGIQADSLAQEIRTWVAGMQKGVREGKGPVNALLYDSLLVNKLNRSLENIEKGTDGFNQNMEALKHSIFFRGYFRKQEKKKNQVEQTPAP